MKIRLLFFFLLFIFGVSSCSNDDNPITVTTADFTTALDENPTFNQEIGNIIGQTNQGNLNFSIISQTPDGAFSISSTTGRLTVLDPLLFDFETNPTIIGIVEVSNGSISELSKITINLNDLEEDTFNGNVLLTTQEEINEFGTMNYKTINGDLTIDENQAIHNIVFLDALSTIKSITGKLTINNMFNLLDIPSFQNLESVGGIVITNNWGILDMNSFSNINNCNGSITINNNQDLGSYCGIKPLLKDGNFIGTLSISDNFYNPSQDDIVNGDCESF